MNTIQLSHFIDLVSDAKRRDLTTNSIASSTDMKTFYDPFGGIRDLQMKVLRHTSEAFKDDPLRVVRLARFYARYQDFTVAEETMAMAKGVVDSGEMDHITDERYWAEIVKVFSDKTGSVIRFFDLLKQLGVFNKVKYFFRWAECMNMSFFSIFENKFRSIENVDVVLAAFFVNSCSTELPKKCTNVVTDIAKSLRVYYNAKIGRDSNEAHAKGYLNFLKVTGSLNHKSDLLKHVMDVELAFNDTASVELVYALADASGSVKGEMFPGVEGKALGKAIEEERVRRFVEIFTKQIS